MWPSNWRSFGWYSDQKMIYSVLMGFPTSRQPDAWMEERWSWKGAKSGVWISDLCSLLFIDEVHQWNVSFVVSQTAQPFCDIQDIYFTFKRRFRANYSPYCLLGVQSLPGGGPGTDGFISSDSTSVFINLKKHFPSGAQANAVFTNLVSGLGLCPRSGSVWAYQCVGFFKLDKKQDIREQLRGPWFSWHTIPGSVATL